jgi:hypothetical protein
MSDNPTNVTPRPARRGYAGADWMESNIRARGASPMSPLGVTVANLLGELYLGIYHVPVRALSRAEWHNPHVVILTVRGTLSTFDFDELTRLVLLAHERCIRVEIDGAAPGYLRLMFSRRTRSGDTTKRHPTIAQAITAHESKFGPLDPDEVTEGAADTGATS